MLTVLSHLVLYDRKHFCSIFTNLSNLSHSKWLFLLFQKIALASSNLKNVPKKHFLKMQPFLSVLQNGPSYKLPDVYKEISVLESLFNKITGLMACNFVKKESPTHVFSCEYHKIAFFMEHLRRLLLKMVEEFLRISNPTWVRFVEKNFYMTKICKDIL